jgi:hypothetical protein
VSSFDLGTREIRALQFSIPKIGIPQIAVDQTGPSKVRANQPRTSKRGAINFRSSKTCALEIGRDGDSICADIRQC